MFYSVSYSVRPCHHVIERRFNDLESAKNVARSLYFDNPRAVGVRVSMYQDRPGLAPMVVKYSIEFRF